VFPRTRLRAVELAVKVFSLLGRDALTPLIATLRPAVRNLVLQRFEEAEQDPDANPEIEDVTSPRGKRSASILIPQDKPNDKISDAGGTIPRRNVSIRPPSTPHASAKRPSQRKTKRVDTPMHGSHGRQSKVLKPSHHWQVVPAAAAAAAAAAAEHQRWKSVLNDHEEDMMDAILEEAGFVFGKSDRVALSLDDEIEFLGLDHDLGNSVPVLLCC